ncbi:MAG: hypothetical protein SAK29_10100 [Scytonema sp. PMC 1069.18]|nr:hypothetical protein [Scytonema sp. PMC 1069.18]MEC4886014.1 hypothetical protein [Scytonema sp. PMC 1070.18]
MSQFERLSPEDVEYVLNLPYHLAEADMVDDLCELLTEFEFIEYKILTLAPQPLIEDYSLALSCDLQISEEVKRSLELIQSAIRLSANVIDNDKAQLAEQLWGRLISYKFPEIQKLLERLRYKDSCWLRSLSPTLTQAGGRLLRTFTLGNAYVKALSVTPDSKYIISGLSNGSIKIWELESGLELYTCTGHSETVNSIAVIPNGEQIISGSADQTVKVWDLRTGDEILTLKGHISAVKTIIVTPDSKWIISGSDDGNIKIWDLKEGEENIAGKILFGLFSHESSITTLAVTPNYENQSKRVISGSADNTLKIWNLESTGELNYEIFDLKGHTSEVNTVVCSLDGKMIISGSSDKTIKIWSLSTRETLFTLTGHTDKVNVVALSPNSKQLISGSDDKTIKVWNLQTNKELFTLTGHISKVNAVVVTPDEKRLISGSSDGTIKIWNLETLIKVSHLETEESNISLGHLDSLEALAFTPDGKQGISASVDGTIQVWNLEDRKAIFTLTGHTSTVKLLIVAPDSKRLISSSDDKTIKVWSLETGKEFLTVTGRGDGSHSVAVTNNGKYMISIASDKNLEIWHLDSQQLVTRFSGDSPLNCCAIAPDGVTIMAGEESGQIHFLHLEETNTPRC